MGSLQRRRAGRAQQMKLNRAELARLKAHRAELVRSGLPKHEVRSRVRLARRSLVEARAGRGPGPLRAGPPLPRPVAGQGAYLSPAQIGQSAPQHSIADEVQSFTMDGLGMGQQGYTPQQIAAMNAQRQALWHAQRSAYGQRSGGAAARLYALQQKAAGLARKYVAPATKSAPGGPPASHEGGARMYVDPTAQLQTSFIEGKINLEPVCDESGKCIRYVDPAHVQKMIGQKVDGRSALGTGSMQLPGFYSHPTLGPYGVDPNQAYQYWAAQQAAMQAGAFASPMQSAVTSIWGSPGMQAHAPQLPAAPGASASFASVPGQATERF
jgi:hypothetical protein